jgi:hypothetical protein
VKPELLILSASLAVSGRELTGAELQPIKETYTAFWFA